MKNIDDLTIGEAKQLAAMFGSQKSSGGLKGMIGEKVIIRTYSAGVWFGTLTQKAGNEVIIKDARRMWRWCAKKSISLSAVALYGVQQEKSKIAPALPSVWLEAIEIIPCSADAIESIQGCPDVEAE
ncbi:DUF6948 domain-containing protein [Sulfurimonas sp. ST-25]|uniref:DUF6948 domain-containing protein n=1 Tax=Sulfurimonas sp. ST-25 TaxID=3400151 RepID=UPI003A84430E